MHVLSDFIKKIKEAPHPFAVVVKLNGQSIPRNHNISKTNDELNVVSHTLPRNTQDISNN